MAFGFSFSHKTKDIKNLWKDFGQTAANTLTAGNTLVNQEVGTLRGYNANYAEALKNPLGTGPNSAAGIFTRARGALSDTATQRAGAFGARLKQQAVQGGGNLSAAAQAQLEESNQRDINQQLFEGNVGISNAEATMTLSETSKLFDRMEGISRTILGVGQNQAAQGWQGIIQSILGRQSLSQSNIANAISAVGTAASAGASVAGAGSGAVIAHDGGSKNGGGNEYGQPSMRVLKTAIKSLDSAAAKAAFFDLRPVTFAYRETGEQHAGFIADDVPELLALPGRAALYPMDFIAVLTSVVQEQAIRLAEVESRMEGART